jgi:cell filamentation protein
MARIESDILNYKSPYTIDGNDESVLKNKLGIDDVEHLNTAERMITSFKLSKMYLATGAQTFDTGHLVSIHKYLFEDIYDFAGKIRCENIAKSFTFCLVPYINEQLRFSLRKAANMVPNVVNREKLLDFIVEIYSDLDMIHPFREGNGRTEREFMRQYIDYICEKNGLDSYYLDYGMITDRDAYIYAITQADVLCNYGPLRDMFDKILKVKEKDKTVNTSPKL